MTAYRAVPALLMMSSAEELRRTREDGAALSSRSGGWSTRSNLRAVSVLGCSPLRISEMMLGARNQPGKPFGA